MLWGKRLSPSMSTEHSLVENIWLNVKLNTQITHLLKINFVISYSLFKVIFHSKLILIFDFGKIKT